MDLRNYGVIDFAEHVVLPTGDADDFDNWHQYDCIEGVSGVFRKGTKQTIIDDLKETNKNLHTDLLLKDEQLAESKAQLLEEQRRSEAQLLEEQRRSEKMYAYKYSQLVKTAEDRDKKEEENRDLKAQIKSLKAFNLKLFEFEHNQKTKKNKMINILNGKNIDKKDVAQKTKTQLEEALSTLNSKQKGVTYVGVLQEYITQSIVKEQILNKLHELVNT